MSRVSAAGSGAQVFQKRELLLLLLGFGLLVAWRLPQAWVEGRFLAEEASVFLSYAWNFPAGDALFRPFAGYLNLAANATTLLLATAIKAGFVPLADAPYVTMVIGLLFQLAPLALLLTGSASWLPHRRARLIAAGFVVLLPASEELYLNVMHIQFQLALCAALMLVLDVPQSIRTRFCYGMILVFAPLCGPGAILLLPMFVLKVLVERSRGRTEQALLLAFGAAIQLLVFFDPGPGRGLPTAPLILGASLFIRLIALPLSGTLPAGLLGMEAGDSVGSGSLLLPVLAALACLFLGALGLWCARKRDPAIWMFVTALFMATASLGMGVASRPDYAPRAVLSGVEGLRYTYIPVILLLLSMLQLSLRQDSKARTLAKGVIVLNLAAGAAFFCLPQPMYNSGPSWREEVRQWKGDRNHLLAVWPRNFVADLSGKATPCIRLAVAPGDPRTPRYCESGWLADLYPNVHGMALIATRAD